MELKRLLNRVIDLCAQGQLEGAETVAEYALAEADKLLKDLMAYHSQTDLMRSQMAAMAAEMEDMQKEINSLKGSDARGE